ASRTRCTAGNRRPSNTAMIAMTTSNSTRVKAVRFTGVSSVGPYRLPEHQGQNQLGERGHAAGLREKTAHPGSLGLHSLQQDFGLEPAVGGLVHVRLGEPAGIEPLLVCLFNVLCHLEMSFECCDLVRLFVAQLQLGP